MSATPTPTSPVQSSWPTGVEDGWGCVSEMFTKVVEDINSGAKFKTFQVSGFSRKTMSQAPPARFKL